MAQGEGSDWVQPCTLERGEIAIVPLTDEHFRPLFERAELEFFQHYVTLMPVVWTYDEWVDFLTGVLRTPRCIPFCVLHRGEPVGMTTYMDIRPEARGLEIGMTWIARDLWGTTVNPTIKFLMLGHAFDELEAIRVQLKTDARNVHSQAAILKLGAKQEGTLRRHGIQRTRFIRDTVMFSILDSEWPAVRDGLLRRLETFS